MTGERRLLVVDDDRTVGLVLVYSAQAIGFEARLCEDVHDFLEQCTSWVPTHVGIDLTMPQMSGSQLLAELARRGCRARVVICSGAGPAALRSALAECRALGLDAAGVLEKPYSVSGLRTLFGTTPQVPSADAPVA